MSGSVAPYFGYRQQMFIELSKIDVMQLSIDRGSSEIIRLKGANHVEIDGRLSTWIHEYDHDGDLVFCSNSK